MKSRCMFDEQKTVIYFWFKDPSKLDSAAIARIALVINLSGTQEISLLVSKAMS